MNFLLQDLWREPYGSDAKLICEYVVLHKLQGQEISVETLGERLSLTIDETIHACEQLRQADMGGFGSDGANRKAFVFHTGSNWDRMYKNAISGLAKHHEVADAAAQIAELEKEIDRLSSEVKKRDAKIKDLQTLAPKTPKKKASKKKVTKKEAENGQSVDV